MDKNKSDIYRAIVDMSSRDVQHDAFKYIKRWWKNGKWNYEYKKDAKTKTTKNPLISVKDKTTTNVKKRSTVSIISQAKQHGKYVTKDPRQVSDDQVAATAAITARKKLAQAKLNPGDNQNTNEALKRSVSQTKPNNIKVSYITDETKKEISNTKPTAMQRGKQLLPTESNPLPSLKLKEGTSTIAEDAAAVNPNYDPNKIEYSYNCSYCTLAYDLRRRGYDIEANAIDIDRDDTRMVNIAKWYEDTDSDAVRSTHDIIYDQIDKKKNDLDRMIESLDRATKLKPDEALNLVITDMQTQPDGARGHFYMAWKSGNAHDIAYEKIDGKLIFIDAQVNKVMTQEEYIKQYGSRAYDFSYIRSDDKKLSKKMLSRLRNVKNK